MKYRALGSTGIEVSEIGYGTWGLGGNAYGPVDDNESKKALRRAFEKGINFFDTSDLYGNGHSEQLLGEVFRDVRDAVVIATKGGTLPHSGFYMPQDFSPKYLRNALEGSLKRLKTDYIDLYQLHSPQIQDIEANADILDTLETFKSEGKIKAYGISPRSPQDAIIAIQQFRFTVVQVNFNLIDQRAIETGLFKIAAEKNVGIINRTPLVFGYLSGKMTGDERFDGVDHRANWPKEQLKRWAKSPNLFDFLYENGKQRSAVQAALLFCLAHREISTVIPGMLNVQEVEEDIEVANLPPLNSDEIGKIREIYRTHDFYDRQAKQKGCNT
ncbi:MAG: aldo/keto reductase [Thermodesulfobacteriota bacterium]